MTDLSDLIEWCKEIDTINANRQPKISMGKNQFNQLTELHNKHYESKH